MKRILIADDDPGIQDATKLILERAGYHVVVLPNGEPLLEETEYELPNVFILDKQLPGIDGLDICRYLKSQDLTKNIPVIMLSASPLIAKLAKSAGADDFLEKPFKMKDLLNIVLKYA